jgi:hypothetical protein
LMVSTFPGPAPLMICPSTGTAPLTEPSPGAESSF